MRGPNPPQLDKGSFLQNGETVFTFSSLTQMLRGHTPFQMFRFWKWGPVDKMGTSWLAFVDKAWSPYSWQSCVKWDGGRRLKLIFRISCDSVTISHERVVLCDSVMPSNLMLNILQLFQMSGRYKMDKKVKVTCFSILYLFAPKNASSLKLISVSISSWSKYLYL